MFNYNLGFSKLLKQVMKPINNICFKAEAN